MEASINGDSETEQAAGDHDEVQLCPLGLNQTFLDQ